MSAAAARRRRALPRRAAPRGGRGAAPPLDRGPVRDRVARPRAAARRARCATSRPRSGVTFCYKSSYDKANRIERRRRSAGRASRRASRILADVKRDVGVPVLTDFHTPHEAAAVGQVVDVLQVPAFLCRQTDMLLAAAATGKAVSVKKGQFLAPWDMKNVVGEAPRGRLPRHPADRARRVVRLRRARRRLPLAARHARPRRARSASTRRTRSSARAGSATARAATAARCPRSRARPPRSGIDALFTEVHEDPDHAPSDGPNMLVPRHGGRPDPHRRRDPRGGAERSRSASPSPVRRAEAGGA